MLADFVVSTLFPRVDFVIDLHSGGRSLEFLPCALAKYSDNGSATETAQLELLRQFAAPVSYLTSGKGGGGETTLAAAAQQLNVPAIMTELGGGERISLKGLVIAKNGILNVLRAQGILRSERSFADLNSTRFMRVNGPADYVYAPHDCIFEPLVELGQSVNEGDPAGRLYRYGELDEQPRILNFESSGTVACKRSQSSARHGDCLFHLFQEIDDPGN